MVNSQSTDSRYYFICNMFMACTFILIPFELGNSTCTPLLLLRMLSPNSGPTLAQARAAPRTLARGVAPNMSVEHVGKRSLAVAVSLQNVGVAVRRMLEQHERSNVGRYSTAVVSRRENVAGVTLDIELGSFPLFTSHNQTQHAFG